MEEREMIKTRILNTMQRLEKMGVNPVLGAIPFALKIYDEVVEESEESYGKTEEEVLLLIEEAKQELDQQDAIKA